VRQISIDEINTHRYITISLIFAVFVRFLKKVLKKVNITRIRPITKSRRSVIEGGSLGIPEFG